MNKRDGTVVGRGGGRGGGSIRCLEPARYMLAAPSEFAYVLTTAPTGLFFSLDFACGSWIYVPGD